MNFWRRHRSCRQRHAHWRSCPLPVHAAGLVLVASIVAGCGALATGPGAGVVSVPSANHNARRTNFVILQETTNSTVEPALKTLSDPGRGGRSLY